MKLNVAIYIEPVKVSSKTGISRHIIGLVEALLKAGSSNHYYLYYQVNLLGSDDIKWLKDEGNVTLRPLRFPAKWLDEHPSLWWKYYLPLRLWMDKIDVFHGANHFIPLKGNIPTVVTIHDLAYYYMVVHGEGFDRVLKNWTDQAMQRADIVVAVSQSTANDCIKEGVSSKKVKVVYQGFESPLIETNISNTEEKQYAKPYILYVGTIQPRKNIEYIIQSFAQIKDTIPHTLILAGAPGDSSEQVNNLINTFNIKDRIILTGYISDQQRHALYKEADMFLYPSKYEGFGLVLLEAMSYGVPVITASNSSLVEAAGDAAIYCDGINTSSLTDAITRLIKDEDLRNTLISNGFKQIDKFKWTDCAKQMLSIYHSVAPNKAP